MYGFRKPFAAAGYDGADEFFGLEFKTALVISQVLGYTLSKFIGIKVISEMGKNNRARTILILIGIAELALLGFAVVPEKLKLGFMFLNGLPLGMVWGLVFSYLEGRRFTEAMGAGLCASFAFASGFAKTIGKSVQQFLETTDLTVYWMPVMSGAVYLVPLVIFTLMLNAIPEPTQEDEELRTKRVPMTGADRIKFFKTFGPGMVMLILAYMFLTAFRDFRDNFMNEILKGLGITDQPDIFTTTEIPVTLGVLALLGTIMFIKDNLRALLVNHWVIAGGFAIAGISTYAFQQGIISPVVWIMLTGFATYTAYIPFNCIIFERLIAAFKYQSNAGFLIYVADAFGYLSVVGVLLYKDLAVKNISWLSFFTSSCYLLAIVGVILSLMSMLYFMNKHVNWHKAKA